MTDVEPVTSRKSTVLRAVLVVVLVFAAGVATGFVGDRAYLLFHDRVIPRGGLEFMAKHMLRRMDRELDLSPAQEAQVKAILDRGTERMGGRMKSLHDALHEEFEVTSREIEAVLTPEQRVRFEKMQHRWHGRRRR